MKYNFFASSPRYVEDILARELRDFGAGNINITKTGISFTGSMETAYRGCLWSRVGNRIILFIKSFAFSSVDDIYRHGLKIEWKDHLPVNSSFKIESVAVKNLPFAHKYAVLKLKDAVCDYFRQKTGKRPDIDRKTPDITIFLSINTGTAEIGIDLSGESLHKRNYRLCGVHAPLKENIAAAMLYRAGWDRTGSSGNTFCDPMCGSGTLLVEAAFMSGDIAPGLGRTKYGFLKWKGHTPGLWRNLIHEAEERKKQGIRKLGSFYGFDSDAKAIDAALKNIHAAGLDSIIKVRKKNIKDLSAAHLGSPLPGLVAINPPYGKRLGREEDTSHLYRSIGRILKQQFNGWKAVILAGNESLAKNIGLRASKVNKLYNGKIKCILVCFDITEDNKFI